MIDTWSITVDSPEFCCIYKFENLTFRNKYC